MSRAAAEDSATGEISSTLKTLGARSQSPHGGPVCPLINWLAKPTPMMEPTMVCELEAGSPNHHVLKFQMMAAINSAKTIANPAPELTCRINSTGSNVMTLKATAPDDTSTPARLHSPDHTTAIFGSSEWVSITAATGLAVSWNPLPNWTPREIGTRP